MIKRRGEGVRGKGGRSGGGGKGGHRRRCGVRRNVCAAVSPAIWSPDYHVFLGV